MTLDDANRTIREAVAARMAATPADDPKLVGYQAGGCPGCEGSPFVSKAAAVAGRLAVIADELPPEFVEATRHLTFRPATPTPPAEFTVKQIGATMSPEQLEAAWAGIKARREEAIARMRGEPIETIEIPAAPPKPFRLIGVTGPAGCGKNTVANMVPGAVVMQIADPLYAALAVMLGVPEAGLRSRATKEQPIEWLGKSPRQLLQTLGTEWGRMLVADDVWLKIAARRIDELAASGASCAVLADVRFDNEAQMIRQRGGEVWRVERTPASETYSHVSEAGIYVHLIDRVIDNTGTPDETRRHVEAALALR